MTSSAKDPDDQALNEHISARLRAAAESKAARDHDWAARDRFEDDRDAAEILAEARAAAARSPWTGRSGRTA